MTHDLVEQCMQTFPIFQINHHSSLLILLVLLLHVNTIESDDYKQNLAADYQSCQ